MERLKICGRFETHQFEGCVFSHMVSIGDHDDFFDGLRLAGIREDQHLCLRFTDTEDVNHPDAPTSEALAPLFDWLSGSQVEGLLVHCAAGISRSPAVALLCLCFIAPNLSPREHMTMVAASSECGYIWPNRLVVKLGDGLLLQKGAIVAGLDDWRNSQDEQPVEFV